jgi:hypothetical protein
MEGRIKNLIKTLIANEMEELESIINHLQQVHNYLALSIEESEKTIKDPQNLVEPKPSANSNFFPGYEDSQFKVVPIVSTIDMKMKSSTTDVK